MTGRLVRPIEGSLLRHFRLRLFRIAGDAFPAGVVVVGRRSGFFGRRRRGLVGDCFCKDWGLDGGTWDLVAESLRERRLVG